MIRKVAGFLLRPYGSTKGSNGLLNSRYSVRFVPIDIELWSTAAVW